MSSIKVFKERYTLSRRRQVVERYFEGHPHRCPINLFRSNIGIPVPNKSRYLVPYHMTFGSFLLEARKYIKIDQYETIFLFVHVKGNPNTTIMVRSSDTIASLYETYKDEDGFLYISYDLEKCFG
jgi:hypothetical protein